MRLGLYLRLALDGMVKNRKLYLPYLTTGILMTTIYNIMSFLAHDDAISNMPGGATTSTILMLGSNIIGIFAVLFLFYTNTFLLRQRKKEFGLYNVLGMNKGSLQCILFFETLLFGVVSIIAGIALGTGCSKLAELGLLNIMDGTIDYTFSSPIPAAVQTGIMFAVIYFLIYLNAFRQIQFSNPMDLVSSEAVGEKPPKANWLLGILGIVLLAGAYYLAVSIQQPMSALMWFFVAVIMVILATYLLFIAGSVMLCKVLQKNKNYYYKTKHFVSVSSMTYRMKRNGAGLASICILMTMVLVMLSSTASLYLGADDCLVASYPRDICAIAAGYDYDIENTRNADAQHVKDEIYQLVEDKHEKIENEWLYDEYSITGYLENSYVNIKLNSKSDLSFVDYDKVAQVHFIALSDYNRMYHKNEKLQDGEALVCAVKTNDISDTLKVGHLDFHVKKRIDYTDLDLQDSSPAAVSANIFVIVPNLEATAMEYKDYTDYDGSSMLLWRWFCGFDTNLSEQQQLQVTREIEKVIKDGFSNVELDNSYCNSRAMEKGDFYGTFGGLFFLGVLLTIVFLTAAVLIIYYKQISEGYEDQARFEIMQQIGMTKKEIRSSINSQMLTIFFLPILLAVLHVCFAFPVINKLLMLFGLFNVQLYMLVTAVCILAFSAFYAVVYRITSNSYYSIVSGTMH